MKNKQGFTLIEMLVVVLIIGILAGIALPQYEMAVEKAKATEALMNMRTIISNVERVILLNGNEDKTVYANSENWDTDLSGGNWYDNGCCGPMFITDNYIYLTADDETGISAIRCNGKCRQSNDAVDDDSIYDLFGCYPSVNGDCPFSCYAESNKGKKICKALEGLGVENDS